MMMSDEEYDLPPLDIVIEIMKRLPIKSLIKFMSVSKQWKSVIQSSPFISDYNNIQPPSSSNLFFAGFNDGICAIVQNKLCKDDDDDSSNQQLLTLPDSDDFGDFNSYELIGYSQGLFGFFISKDRLVIWNPSIRKSVFIPLPPDHGRYDEFCFTVVCNATEPTIFCTTSFTTPLRVQIYTLTTGAWRTISNTPPRASLRVIALPGLREVTDRFIYWIACDDSFNNLMILSFDITSEQFTELCLPPTLAANMVYGLELSKLRESLVVLEMDYRKKEVSVWMMMMEPGVGNSFTKQFTLNLPNQEIYYEKKVLGFTTDGEIILQMSVYPDKWKVLFYEPDSKSFIDIGKPRKKYSNLAGSYMETLLLLDH